MSTFSNWNGPSVPGTSLPQVRTLEELISQLHVVSNHARDIAVALDNHERSVLLGLHGPIQDDYNTKINALRNEIGSIGSTTGRIVEALQSARMYTDSVIGGALPQGTVRATTDALNLALTNLTLDLKATEARLNSSISANQSSVNNTFAQMLQETQTALLKVQTMEAIDGLAIDVTNDLNIVGNILMDGNIKLDSSIDFTKWATVQAQAVPDGSTTDNIVLLLGCLSKDWDAGVNFPDAQQHKAATVYVKYVNSMPWNAVLNLTATIDFNAGTDTRYTGSIFGVVSKTNTRGDMKFGVYRDTVPSGEERIYLGIKVQETVGHAIAGQSFTSYTFNVAGINFDPLTPELRANSSVKEIALVGIANDFGGVVMGPVISNYVYSDNYMDDMGHGVAVTDETGNKLTVGSIHHLNLVSSDRPNVISGGSFERLAFLSDLTTSIKWQRAVKVIAANATDLNGLMVTVDSNDVPQTWNPTGTNKPGIYTSDKTMVHPNALLFINGDAALVEDSGTKSAALADALYNGTFASLTPDSSGQISIPFPDLIGLDVDHVKQSATPTNPATIDGTIFIDTTGAYAKVNVINQVTQAYQCVIVTGVPPYEYTEPAYYTFNGTTWSLVETIATPGNEAKHISNISYQWSGMVLDDTGFFANAYVIWTPSYENETTMSYTPEQLVWSNNIIVTPNMRTANEQDQIDMKITSLALIQPDYAENQDTITSPLDGSIVPNPAYIHNKLLIGMSLADGGVFSGGEWNNTWLLDGGDLTEVWRPNFTSPVINTSQQFQNVVIRLWRGDLSQMLEVYDHMTNTWSTNNNQWVWATYKFVPRYVIDTQEFMISDGMSRVIRFIPFDNYKSTYEEVMQYVHMSATTSAVAFTFESTNFDIIGTPQLISRAYQLVAANNTLNFAYDDTSNTTTITSTRMDTIEADIVDIKATYLPLAGGTMTGALNMGDQAISDVLSVTSATAGATLDGIWTVNANVTFAEPLNMGNKAINNVLTPVGANDAANKSYVDDTVDTKVADYLPLAGGTLTGALAMTNNSLTEVGEVIFSAIPVSGTTTEYTWTIKTANVQNIGPAVVINGSTQSGVIGAALNLASDDGSNFGTLSGVSSITLGSNATITMGGGPGTGLGSLSGARWSYFNTPSDTNEIVNKNYADTTLRGITLPALPTTGGPYTLQYNTTTGAFTWVT